MEKGKTIGELMEEMRLKAGAKEYHGHEYMDLNRFADDTRHMIKRKSPAVHQFIISPIERHSKKPDEARQKIVQLMGDVPRIELFARQASPGWDVWGNEAPGSEIIPEMEVK